MVALADGVADYVAGAVTSARHSFKSGLGRGMDFQTEAPADVSAYRTELESMGEVEELIHYVGTAVEEILNAVTLGHFERKDYRELTVGGSDDYWNIDLSGYKTAEEKVDAMINAYRAAGGTFDEDENREEGREGNSDLEASVGDAENNNSDEERDDHYADSRGSNRRRYFADGNGGGNTRRRELEDSVSEVKYDYPIDESDKRGFYEAFSDEVFWKEIVEAYDSKISTEKAIAEDRAERVAELDARVEARRLANEEEDRKLQNRINTEKSGLARNLDDLDSFMLPELRERVSEGYMSTLGVPYVEGTHCGIRPRKERDFTDEEKRSLINRVMVGN